MTVSTFVLVVFFHAGMMASDNSNSAAVIEGFTSEESCRSQIRKVKSLANGQKTANAICIEVK